MALVPLEQYNQSTGQGVDYDTLFQQKNQENYSGYGLYNSDEGSILNTISEKWKTANEAFWSTQAGQEHSQLANRMLQEQAAKAKAEQEKLGMAGNIVAGAANIVPIVGAGMVNPLLGGAVASGLYTGETLAQQAMEGQTPSLGSALAAGTATGAVDMLTGGLAGRARAALPAAAPLRQRAAIAATEDVSSALAGNAFTNLATGKDWDEGMLEAGLMGAGGGAALRGSLAGLNKTMQFANTPKGERSVAGLFGMKKDNGLTPTDTFVGEVYGYNNAQANMMNEVMNARSPEARAEAINATVNMAAQSGGRAADALALQIAKDTELPLTDNAFDIDVSRGLKQTGEAYRLGHEMGLTDKEMNVAGEAIENARAGRFTRHGAVEKGLTKEADQEKFQKGYQKTMGMMKGSYDQNIGLVDQMVYVGKNDPDMPADRMSSLKELSTDLRQLKVLMDEYSGQQKVDVSGNLEIVSSRILDNATKLGVLDKLQGVDGKAGTFDPVVGVMAVDRMERMAAARMPSVKHGSPNKRRTLLGTGAVGTAIDTALLLTGNPLAAAARRGAAMGVEAGSAAGSRRALRKARDVTSQRLAGVQRALESRKNQALAEGDVAGAADIARADLEAEGLAPKSVVNESVIDEALNQPSQVDVSDSMFKSSPLNARDPRAAQTAAQAVPEEVVEAPVVTPEPEVRSAPVPAREPTRPVADPDIVEEPVNVPPPVSPQMAGDPAQAARALIAAKLQQQMQPAPEKAIESPAAMGESATEDLMIDNILNAPPEAPRTRSKDMVRQPKQPQAEEPEIAPEPTPEPEKPRVKSTDLVRNKLEERKEKFEDMSAKERQDMLKTDPEQYRQMERAREDLEKTNTLIDSLASKHKMSEEAVADYINEMGGVDGVRKEMRDKSIKGTEHQYIDRRIREMEDLKTKEAKSKVSNLRDTAAKAVSEDTGVKVDPEFEARVIADKHMQVRDELSSLGFEDDIINQALKNAKATDTTSDFDPKIVKNWAKTLQKKQVDEAKASMAEANEKAKEAVQRASEHAKKPMPEGERVAAERQLKEQISAHEGVLKKKGVSATDRAKSQAQLDKLNRALTQLSERETKLAQAKRDADAEAKEATKEMERTRREYEQLWKKAEKRMDDIQKSVADGEKLAKQEKDMTEALVAMGAPESTAQRILHNMFISREKPLSDAEFSKLRARAVQDLEKAKEAETKVAKEAVKEDVAKMSDSELEAAAKEVLAVRREVKDLSATEQQAVTQAIIDELNARGQEGEATYMKAFNQIVARAEERKKQFPNNKKLWISADDKQLLQELMNKGEGKSWMGNLQKQLASRFFGDAESGSKYIRLSEEEIEKRVKMGLVDDDLVDAPRASWKKIGRKVNKSDK